MPTITRTSCEFEREPFLNPFGFKGGYISEMWQVVAMMEDGAGRHSVGLGGQSILWSDGAIFSSRPQSVGNCEMFLMSSFALKHAEGLSWDTPLDLVEQLIPPTLEFGKTITRHPELRLTFALNSLVAVDNAAWLLYSSQNKIMDFLDMVPADFRTALSHRHEKLVSVPLITYAVSLAELQKIIEAGACFLKIKVGSDPGKDGDQEKMLEWDKQRLSEIHELARDYTTPYTECGRICYYLDANGRYESKECLLRLLDHADHIGAMERILIFEEPFPEECLDEVYDLPVRIAADESAHSDKETLERIDLGYGAIALKPIAKTLSVSLKAAKIAHERNVPCFCADLTVSPVMVDWNKNVAARITPLPGMKVGLVETNGDQNYVNWDKMRSYHPCYAAPWTLPENGCFSLDDDFYKKSGGIFEVGEYYQEQVGLKPTGG
jgi:hypothetical protein